jgi:hypothetical protein
MSNRICSSYIHKLQGIFCEIDNRGICIDKEAIENAKIYVDTEIKRNLNICSSQWGCHVYIGTDNGYGKEHPEFDNQVNINSSSGEKTLLRKLKDLGYKVPTITKRNEEGEYEARYSTGELTLQKMLVENQFNYAGGDPAIRSVLQVRELGKLKSSYLGCRFYKSTDGLLLYLSHYNAAGTLTGRRSSKKHTFGFGNNAQNFPKHGGLARIFRRCLIARPGQIFLSVDQKGAEEWPVLALAENLVALGEMQAGVNRHIRRASGIFGIPETSRTKEEWKNSTEYYLGKKCGHANNYRMKPPRMSDALAQEGHSIPPSACKVMLDKLNRLEPQIQGVFHKYVNDQINKTRMLVSPEPFLRERQFLGLRPNDSNYKLFNEAYAHIPQSTVGDNNGAAVAFLETSLPSGERAIIQECHDSIVQDIPAEASRIWEYLRVTVQSYNRPIRFHNSIEVNIPVEAEIGYNMASMVTIETLDYEGVCAALKKCDLLREQELDQKRAQAQYQSVIDIASAVI